MPPSVVNVRMDKVYRFFIESGMLAAMAFSSELLTRAVENVIPRDLAEQKLNSGKPIRLYLGIDPTGSKLHLGHAVQLRKLKAFAEAGHHVIFLVGSFTAMIGDPSGRDKQREPLTREQVEENFKTYKEQASKILDFAKIEIRYNHEWLDTLSQKELLKMACFFTKQQLEQREMFVRREQAGQPIYLYEFLYPLYVGYDSVALDVDCEIGGSDQEFNMLCGRTLQKVLAGREKFVVTNKIINGLDGRKMSKTYDNCIYLEDSPTDMFGKTMSIKDELITVYMECCTDMPMEEIAAAEQEMKNGANPKEFKVRLAKEIVTLYHGADAAAQAEKEFGTVFAKGGVPDDMPEVQAQQDELLIDLLVRTNMVASKSDVKRLIDQKGIALNDCLIDAIDQIAEPGVVRVGKRKFLKIL